MSQNVKLINKKKTLIYNEKVLMYNRYSNLINQYFNHMYRKHDGKLPDKQHRNPEC